MKAAAWAIKSFRAVAAPGWRAAFIASLITGILKLTKPRGDRIFSNLGLVYPESSIQWRKSLRAGLYEHLGLTVAEILSLWRAPEQAMEWIDELDRPEILEKALKEHKGLLFVSGHYGNWELLAAWYAQYLKKNGLGNFYIVIQGFRDKDVEFLIVESRKRAGIRFIDKRMSALEMVKLLRSGAHIALLADISWLGGVTLPFMGYPCSNTTGPAVLSMLASVPIIPVSIYRKKPFCHKIQFGEPIAIPEEGNRRQRIEQMTLEANKALEKFIKASPEQWFWLHNRWK